MIWATLYLDKEIEQTVSFPTSNSVKSHDWVMQGVEIVLQGDLTSTVVIQDKQDSNCRCVDNGRSLIGSSSSVDATNKMNSSGQSSLQQAAAITKAPLKVAANKAKSGLNNTLAKLNNGMFILYSSQQRCVIFANDHIGM